MLVILSQKIDTESEYADDLFNTYHYPARYKNLLHKGDVFIYYQGNRYNKDQRYYFGVGTVGEILSADGKNYYAKLIDCQQFEKKVPIWLPDGGYIEQLDYQEVRNSVNPPWQSSIRPVSQRAFDYILNRAGIQKAPDAAKSVDVLKDNLKQSIREFYLGGNDSAILDIESIASAIARSLNVAESEQNREETVEAAYLPSLPPAEIVQNLIDYCKTMKMSYSYKPVLILALLNSRKKDGSVTAERAAKFFREYYETRKKAGLPAEKKKCLYLKDSITDQQIVANVIANPVKALAETPYFYFNSETGVFSFSPEIWDVLDRKSKLALGSVCRQRLIEYFSD